MADQPSVQLSTARTPADLAAASRALQGQIRADLEQLRTDLGAAGIDDGPAVDQLRAVHRRLGELHVVTPEPGGFSPGGSSPGGSSPGGSSPGGSSPGGSSPGGSSPGGSSPGGSSPGGSSPGGHSRFGPDLATTLQRVGAELESALTTAREQLATAGVDQVPGAAERLQAHAGAMRAVDPARFGPGGLEGTSPFEGRGRP